VALSATARRALAGAGLAVFLAWAGYVIAGDRSGLAALAGAGWADLAALAALNLLFLVTNGVYLRRVMASFEVRLSLAEALHLSVTTTALNSFLPLTTGVALRALYLKRAHGFALSRFLGMLAGTYVLNYLVVFLAGVLATAYLYLRWGLASPLLGAVLAAGLAACTALAFFPRWVPRLPGAAGERLARVVASWAVISRDHRLARDISALVIVNLATTAALLGAALGALGVATPFPALLYVATVTSLGLFIKITPGNVGVTEALMVLGGATLQLPVTQTLLAALMVRVTLYLVLAALFPWSMRALFRDGWWAALRESREG